MKKKFLVAAAVVIGLLCIQSVNFYNPPRLDIGTLYNYSDTYVPDYIFSEETFTDTISDELATLGRVLFYDTKLSLNSTISCASCHKQEFAFGDTTLASKGFDGRLTERHSTRLVNLNYNHMPEVFWDMRSPNLDSLPLMVLTNAIEMGFSGKEGQPEIDSLVRRLEDVEYYKPLFELGYGDQEVTSDRINLALTQFVKSIQSFDSRYDLGRSMVGSNKEDFPNFSRTENFGKKLFLSPFAKDGQFEEPEFGRDNVIDGEVLNLLGCAECHGADNFTSRKTSLTGNNGIVGVIGHPELEDTTVLRSPSMRNLFTPSGEEIGPFMHDGSLKDMSSVINHYIKIGINQKAPGLHSSLDIDRPNREYDGLSGPSGFTPPVRTDEKGVDALIAFLKTLTDESFFTDKKWSDPFDADGNIFVTADCESLPHGFEEVTICAGDSYEGFRTEGIHQKIISRAGKCDSVANIELKVEKLVHEEEHALICQGESYEGFKSSGWHSIFEERNDVCYHREINLTVIDSIKERKIRRTCYGDTVEGYSETGIYRDTLYTEGCVQYRILDLEIRPIKDWVRNVSICAGDEFDGYRESGVYIDTVKRYSYLDCLVIRELNLEVRELPTSKVFKQICEGESFAGFRESGVHVDTIASRRYNDCDTIRTIDLEVVPFPKKYEHKEICYGETYNGYYLSGSYESMIPAESGCDTLVFLDLIVLGVNETLVEEAICAGETLGGYSESGIYYDQYIDVNGCDSLRRLELTVLKEDRSEEMVSICEGESYRGYIESGIYRESYINQSGCDSTIIVELDVLRHTESLERIEICHGLDYKGYSESGTFVDYFTNAVGCDSIHIIDLDVRPIIESHFEEYICKGDWIEGYSEEGLYADEFKNAEGCDSLRHLKVSYLPDTESYEEIHLCPGEEFEGHYHAIEYEEYYTNYVGCDSTRLVKVINVDPNDPICAAHWDKEIKNIGETDYIKLYPNPVSDFLTIQVNKPDRIFDQVRIYNVDHRLVLSEKTIKGRSSIDLSELESGLYLIQLIDGKNKFIGKVLKM